MYICNARRDPDNPTKPFFVKPLAHLLQSSLEKVVCRATKENILLTDDSPYKNVINNPFSTFYPTTCTIDLEKMLKKNKKSFFTSVLQPLLRKLLEFGLTDLEFFQN